MNVNILIEYCYKCNLYGWKGTWSGLKKYKSLKERGLIELWNT